MSKHTSHSKIQIILLELHLLLRASIDDQRYHRVTFDTLEALRKLLTENLKVSVSFHNESPISVELPNQVKCKIETTDVALKGQTVSSSYKPAVLNNGLNIQVPPFIEAGDEVIVDTRNLEYIKKI